VHFGAEEESSRLRGISRVGHKAPSLDLQAALPQCTLPGDADAQRVVVITISRLEAADN
jgi:hypothetical protein